MNHPQHILISRTDSIGDVMVTLPLAAWIKQYWPKVRISFAGRSYTKAVIDACPHVDAFVNADALLADSKLSAIETIKHLQVDAVLFAFPDPDWMRLLAEAELPIRIATAKRWASWKYATHKVWFSRKNSELHEAQLNAYLLRPLGIGELPLLDELRGCVALNPTVDLPSIFVCPSQPFVILHPKSKGSAVEWGIPAFRELAVQLIHQGIEVIVTGTRAEGDLIRQDWDMKLKGLVDATGQLSLPELITLIAKAKALVAASTGPLHIAAALGIKAIGLYTPQRPMHPGRWAPLGKDTRVLVAPTHPEAGHLLNIDVDAVIEAITF
jgi:ADP-heptose:LPS heptosyltransferase